MVSAPQTVACRARAWQASIAVFELADGPRIPEVVCDLPAGAKRLRQKADGMRATIMNGELVLRDNEPTGSLPGQLIRKKPKH